MAVVAEHHVEQAALDWLAELGYTIRTGADIGPDGPTPERASSRDVILSGRLCAAVDRLNPALSPEVRSTALHRVGQAAHPDLV